MKLKLLLLAVLTCVVPAYCQKDIDGNVMSTDVRIGFDGFSYSSGAFVAGNTAVGTIDATHRLSERFSIEGIANGGSYFGKEFGGGGLGFTYHPNSSSYVTITGLQNSVTNTTQNWMASIEAGTLLYKAKSQSAGFGSSTGFIKAIEGDYNQTWRGYVIVPNTHVMLYTPRLIFYLPAGWDFMIHAGAIDIIKNGTHTITPTGGARLRIPVTNRLEFTASAGFDAEGITNIQQSNTLSTQNYGGGVKVWLNRTTSIEALGTQSHYTVNHLDGITYGFVLDKRF